MSKSVREVLEELRHFALDERDKGARFERLMKDFLKTDTQYQRLFDEVWLWSEYPDRGNRADTGIDLVARERDTGELIAIQCKFYAPQTLISKPDIDSFLASSSKAEFQGRMFISTSDNWGKNAEEAIAGQKPEVARIGLSDLDNSSIDWEQFSFQTPENFEKKALKSPRPHQEEAIRGVLTGFEAADRGKLIMACGTGKTFTSLKLVERMFPNGGTVLFLVPSISLLSQALKEWTIECQLPLRSYAVCSDVSVGKRKNDEDLPVTDLAFPATTNTERLVQKFTDAGPNQKGLTIIFSTYQSIDVVAQAQARGIPDFDLIICDEAHRTTGVTLSDSDESAFVKVHNQDFIKGSKRLYMTATPKVFSDASTKKAEEAGAVLADMGKPDLFGEEFHRLGFGEAVERGILTDYKVLVLAVDESYVAKRFQRQFADEDNSLKLEDAAKIVGCWNGLSKRSVEQEEFQIDPGAMKRAVAFSRSIAESKKIAEMFQSVVDEETSQLADGEAEYLRCEVEHVDGSFNSLARNEKLDWLKQDIPDTTARILSNARCLTEGVDVPALDAVMFLNPRDSQVDVVQAVGRVMRKLEGKKYGYVILPIGVPADMDPATALNDNSKYKVVWQVLQALRSHDERFDAMVNKIDLTKKAPQIGIIGVGGGSGGDSQDDYGSFTLDFPNFDQWRDAILAKIVQKVGERQYWENWAKEVATITGAFAIRISALTEESSGLLASEFNRFHKGLQANLNPSVSAKDAVEMLAQHMVTKPVFDALFDGFEFADQNSVSLVMEEMVTKLLGSGLEAESATLEKFYEAVKIRLRGIDDPASRQEVLRELYERFFRNAFPRESDRLGIVYTPVELVDFILNSVNDILINHFKLSLSDPNVHILDPFTGTGTFIARLIESGLIHKPDLTRKYSHELHANEITLLAFYIAAVNIEQTFFSAVGGEYRRFGGILLTDSFQSSEAGDEQDLLGVFADNNELIARQNSTPMKVVVGNPPYSAGQLSVNENNQNLQYPSLDESIRKTFAAKSSGQLKTKLYDSYVRAIRWGADRIGSSGVVGYVTNSSFLDGNAADGIRKSLSDEFNHIYVYNLRGAIRGKSGDDAKREGGNVFPIMTGVSMLFLVKTEERTSARPQSKIYLAQMPDYLSGAEKLSKLAKQKSLANIVWEEVRPNDAGDWVNQRDDVFGSFMLATVNPRSKSPERQVGIFDAVSGGVLTARDAWAYNFSRDKLEKNFLQMRSVYEENRKGLHESAHEKDLETVMTSDPRKISWSSGLMAKLKNNVSLGSSHFESREAMYRPFVKQHMLVSKEFIERPSRYRDFFPTPSTRNRAIVCPGPGNLAPRFMALMVGLVPDLGLAGVSGVRFFPRFRFEPVDSAELNLFDDEEMPEGMRRLDNISAASLKEFRRRYGNDVGADDVFNYVYGVLNSREFGEKFSSSLKKEALRVPFVEGFWDYAKVGKDLSAIHVGYESVAVYPTMNSIRTAEFGPIKSMKLVSEDAGSSGAILLVNSEEIARFPREATEYRLGTKHALNWVVERYTPRSDKATGIANDPNDWEQESGQPGYVLDLVGKVANISVQTSALIDKLPSLREQN